MEAARDDSLTRGSAGSRGDRGKTTATGGVRSVDCAKHRLVIDAWIENEAGERVIEGVCEAGLLR